MIQWFGCLGNHDYGYTSLAEAQINYTNIFFYKSWIIPNRYYYMRIKSSQVNISLVVLDSSPCQSLFTSSDLQGWNHC